MFLKLTNKQKFQEGKKRYNLINFAIDNEEVPYKNFTNFMPIRLDYGTPTYLEYNPVKENQFMVTHGRNVQVIDDEVFINVFLLIITGEKGFTQKI